MSQKEDKGHLQVEYFRVALHYYIAARYAMIARLLPTPGNLAHHAIEFLLKGALIETLDETGTRDFHHYLEKLWQLYKSERNNPALEKFDQTISDIHEFERIRYPEEMIRLGMLAEIGPVRNTVPQPPGTKRPPAHITNWRLMRSMNWSNWSFRQNASIHHFSCWEMTPNDI